MLKKFITVLECSRVFSLPMTIMSWFVIFVYAVINAGNIKYGLLALPGICFAHLATNVLDDYFDYKYLIKQVDFDKNEYLRNAQKTKCRYILSGLMSDKDVLFLGLIYLVLAFVIGVVLYIKCGEGVLYYALAGGVIAMLYPLMSRIRCSELFVALAYGPLLFGGVYYVMTGIHSINAFILSLPTMFMTVILAYIHTVMDFEYDRNEGHLTIANSFDSQLDSLVVLKVLTILAYVSLIPLCIFDIFDWQVFLVFLTVPLARDLYESMQEYSVSSESVPPKKWYHFPMENMKYLKKINAQSFMIRMYQSRNLMMYFSLMLCLAIVLSVL